MSNSILTISMITREAMRVLENNLTFTKGVNRQYDAQFGVAGAKIGSTLNVRLPARYVGRDGPTLSIENQVENYSPLTLSFQSGVDVQFTSADMALSMDDFSKRFLEPAMANVANKIDRNGLLQYLNVYQHVGTPGTTPATLTPYLSAMASLDFAAAPRDGMRSIVMDPNANATLVGALTTLFNPTKEISDQYKDGNMGKAIGAKFSMDQNICSQTIGTWLTASPQVATKPASGATSIATKAWGNNASDILNVGDIFTIATCHSVNPQSRQSTGQLQQFVVTAVMVNDGSGNSTISISPAIITSGQGQTVDTLPAVNSAIVPYGASGTVTPQNLLYHRDAFIFASADLPLPKGVDLAARVSDPELGISVRMVRNYDIVNDMFPCRLDVLYGWSTPYPQLACRISG